MWHLTPPPLVVRPLLTDLHPEKSRVVEVIRMLGVCKACQYDERGFLRPFLVADL